MPLLGDTLLAGEKMVTGDALVSKNKKYQAELTEEGDFRIYDMTRVGTPVTWTTGSVGNAVGFATLQTDGNLVIYNVANEPVFNTANPTVNKGVSMVMQNDGKLVVYGVTAIFDSASFRAPGTTPAGAASGNGVNITSLVRDAASLAESVDTIINAGIAMVSLL
jgi:hypothetical protein